MTSRVIRTSGFSKTRGTDKVRIVMSGRVQATLGRAHILAGRGKVPPVDTASAAFSPTVRVLSVPCRDAYLDDAGVMP
ncbi:hypothetical protein [Embleya sp. NPDC050493]|uniref:hypothetical protein n=1 Tax=Embleya sp. NPDC050493 TaxID=3363989 RepID=UPI00379416D4